ncbi:hypothetical protein [Alicyclobacillus kakegawensis]|uniref:hypothetical protein n=1 Tax=Alicyclobacillus kakegawensis TaxID=392012 RepID=UPI000829E1C6|nr:hypothetical protein [Alicyclobacillus kakegawensis]
MNDVHVVMIVSALVLALELVYPALSSSRQRGQCTWVVYLVNLSAVFVQLLTPPGPWLLLMPGALFLYGTCRVLLLAHRRLPVLACGSLLSAWAGRWMWEHYPFNSWHGVPMCVWSGLVCACVLSAMTRDIQEQIMGSGLALLLQLPSRPPWQSYASWVTLVGQWWTVIAVLSVIHVLTRCVLAMRRRGRSGLPVSLS